MAPMHKFDSRHSDSPRNPMISLVICSSEPLIGNQPGHASRGLRQGGESLQKRRQGGGPGFATPASPHLPSCVVSPPLPSFRREQIIAATGTGV